MDYVFPPPQVPSLAVIGSTARFPLRRVYCVGRNYADHAREMGANPDREPPFFFSKPTDAVVPDGGDLPYPPLTRNFHHEVEMVVAIGKGGQNIPEASALEHVFGYAVGLDMTRRDLQLAMKNEGKPWDTGKGADGSAPVSAIRPVALAGHPAQGSISLSVAGQARQSGDLGNMAWSVAEVISRLSTYFRLQPGDLIFTGTPAGVAAVAPGELMEAEVAGVGRLSVRYS